MSSTLSRTLRALADVFDGFDGEHSLDYTIGQENLTLVPRENGTIGLSFQVEGIGNAANFRMCFGSAYFKHAGRMAHFLSQPERDAIMRKEVEDPRVAEIERLRWEREELARTNRQLLQENRQLGGIQGTKPEVMSVSAIAEEVYSDELAREREAHQRTAATLTAQLVECGANPAFDN